MPKKNQDNNSVYQSAMSGILETSKRDLNGRIHVFVFPSPVMGGIQIFGGSHRFKYSAETRQEG